MADRLTSAYETDTQTVGLSDVIRAGLRASSLSTHVAVPATVTKYHPPQAAAGPLSPAKPARVDLQPAFSSTTTDHLGAETTRPRPDMPLVPVAFCAVGGIKMTAEPIAGDEGIVFLCDRSIDIWIDDGGMVDPVLTHAHNLSDGVFFPGLRSGGNALSVPPGKLVLGLEDDTARFELDVNTGAMVLSANAAMDLESGASIGIVADVSVSMSGAVQVEIEAPLIKLGAGAADFAAKGTSIQSAMATWTAGIAAAGAASASAGPTPPGNYAYLAAITALTAQLAATLATWASIKVQVE